MFVSFVYVMVVLLLYQRLFIWRTILRLPENHTAYAALVDKGTHPACETLQKKYPIKSHKLQRVLQRSLLRLVNETVSLLSFVRPPDVR